MAADIKPISTVKPQQPLTPVAAGERAKRMVGMGASVMSRDELIRDVKGGMVFSAPIEGIFESQKYRRGEIDARQYTARIVANTLSFSFWTVGGAMVAATLVPLGYPAFLVAVLGFMAGMLASDVFDRTFGAAIVKLMPGYLDERKLKPFADGFVNYVANPLHDWVWKPISGFVMEHKVLTGVVLAGAALRFPAAAKASGRFLTVMALGTAGALGLQLGVLDRFLPKAQHRH